MSQSEIPLNDQWNSYFPLLFGDCFTDESPDHFKSVVCGNRVSHEEFSQLYAELKAAAASANRSQNCAICLFILTLLLLVPGIVIPIIIEQPSYLGVGIAVPLLLSILCVIKGVNSEMKKRKLMAPILEKHNMMTYHAKGLHWALGHNNSYLHLNLYYGMPPGTYEQVPQQHQQEFSQQQVQLQPYPQQQVNPYTVVQFNELPYGSINQPLLTAKFH